MQLRNLWLPSLIALILSTTSLHADIVDRVIAVVNDDIITLSEINEEGRNVFKNIAAQSAPDKRDSSLQNARMTIIEKMIERRLMLQKAASENISVSDEETENGLQKFLANNNVNMEQFRQQLSLTGITEEKYRSNFKNQIIISRLVNLKVRSKIIIAVDKINEYYENQYSGEISPGQYHILQIGCIKNNKSKQDNGRTARQRIDKIRMLASGGNDFNDLAKKYSDLPSAPDGGDIGFFTKNEMAPAMYRAISSIKPGEISFIIETSSDFQFFKLLSSQEGKQLEKAPLETVKSEIQNKLFQQEMKIRYEEWIKKMRKQAFIKII